jgi:signal transduction histidine kinase
MELDVQLQREREKFRSIQQIARAVGSTLDLDRLLHLIVGKITELMDADRSTLYVMSEDRSMLWTKVLQADELKEIRLRVGEGIAGWVAKTGETVRIEDAYQDPRFNQDVDQRSGYRTRSILCTPMKDNQGRIIGVVQVLNKKGGVFTEEDEELLVALVSQASIAIENSQLYLSVVKNNEQLLTAHRKLARRMRELDLLLEVERQTNVASSLDELLDGLLARTTELIGAEAASILLADQKDERLYFSSALGERGDMVKKHTVAVGEGIAGWVAEHGRPLIINNPEEDPRHNRELAAEVEFYPRNILCVPLVGGSGVLGAIELLNKTGQAPFEDDDQTLLTLVAGRIARAIELAQIKEDQIKQSHLASIGQMLAGMLHDLKTPMTIISGYAQLMAQSDETEVRHRYADQILKQFDVMAAMTKEVLVFARGESNILIRKVYLHKFIAEMEEHLRHEFSGKKITLVVKQNFRGVAYLDETKFRRVFHNIGRNAAQAMPDGGTFSIAVDAVPEENKLVFTFQDTGVGIPPELEGRLFEVFATAGKKEGTGLGLAIVRKIVGEHDGEISYRTGAGEGTQFVITLPLERTTASAQSLPSSHEPQASPAPAG